MATDVLLGILTRLMNGGERNSMTLTLTVKGLIITGDLISAAEYIADFNDKIIAALPEELRNDEQMFMPLAAAETTNEPEHVHMKNVRILGGGGWINLNPSIGSWRGRIDQVDGIMLGSIHPGPMTSR